MEKIKKDSLSKNILRTSFFQIFEINLFQEQPKWNIQDFLTEKSWKRLFKNEFKQDYFIKLNKYLKERYLETAVYPSKELVFNAFNHTSFENVNFQKNLEK